jgi:hypothetical protein
LTQFSHPSVRTPGARLRIANRRQLESLIKQMNALSSEAGAFLLGHATGPGSGAPPQARRSAD